MVLILAYTYQLIVMNYILMQNYSYILMQNDAHLRISLFLKELSLAGEQYLLVGFNDTNSFVSTGSS
jgi:hypothetical protein